MSLEQHAERVRNFFDGDPRITEKRAFGGVMFMLNGNMVVSATRDGGLLVHVAREDVEAGLARDGAEQMVHGGRTMTGFLWVAPYALETAEEFNGWLEFSARSVSTLPPKAPKPPRPARSASSSAPRRKRRTAPRSVQ